LFFHLPIQILLDLKTKTPLRLPILLVIKFEKATLGAVGSPRGINTSREEVPAFITTQLEHNSPIIAVRLLNLQRRIERMTSLGLQWQML